MDFIRGLVLVLLLDGEVFSVLLEEFINLEFCKEDKERKIRKRKKIVEIIVLIFVFVIDE